MATAPPPQRQSVLSERSTTGLTLLDLLEMTPDEIEAHLRATAPQREPAILRPSAPETEPSGLIGAELKPMNPPRDILGEAMAQGSPPVPWLAGYGMLAGMPEDEALMWDTAAGNLGQAATAHVALPYKGAGLRPPARVRGGAPEAPGRQPREEVAPPFYSQARKVVEDPRTQATQTGEAWLRFLSDPKRGVKAEEFQYTGLGDLLKGKAGQRVTREEILGHLDANQIEVKEVTKGAPHEVTWEPDADYPDEVFHGRAPDAKKPRYVVMKERSGPRAGKWIMEDSVSPSRVTGTFDTQEAAQRAATYALGLERSGQPKFSQYALPGAENYREVLLTLPKGERIPEFSEWWAKTKAGRMEDASEGAREVAWQDYLRERERFKGTGDFRSGHWDEPNVLAHLRLSDRTDADGKRVLLVEELQSDWGQKGRREGFKTEVLPPPTEADIQLKRVNAEPGQDPKIYPGYWESFDRRTGQMITRHSGMMNAEQATADALRMGEAASASDKHRAVPGAPFVTDTAKWTALGLKRVLKMAADEGYDRIGIVRGQEQAERYDLSKQVDSVRVVSQGNDQFTVEAMKNGERVVHKTNLPKSELADTIGKDLADQALTQIASGPKTAAEFKGESLRIGGEGMKGYYDKIVPETLNKLAKEYGVKVKLEGGKVKTNPTEGPDYFIESAEDGTFAIIDKADEMGMPVKEGFATKAEAQKYMRELDLDSIPIHTLDVPEAMRKQIRKKGFPLYSRQENLGTLMRNA